MNNKTKTNTGVIKMNNRLINTMVQNQLNQTMNTINNSDSISPRLMNKLGLALSIITSDTGFLVEGTDYTTSSIG